MLRLLRFFITQHIATRQRLQLRRAIVQSRLESVEFVELLPNVIQTFQTNDSPASVHRVFADRQTVEQQLPAVFLEFASYLLDCLRLRLLLLHRRVVLTTESIYRAYAGLFNHRNIFFVIKRKICNKVKRERCAEGEEKTKRDPNIPKIPRKNI